MIEDLDNLPRLNKASFEDHKESGYFGVIGFEDRSLVFLRQTYERRNKLGRIFAIDYLPKNKSNRKEEFLRLAKHVCDDVRVITYDRFSPERFSRLVPSLVRDAVDKKLVVDISGLTRLGIVILITALSNYRGHLTIFYSEADKYYPSREDFESEMKKRGPSSLPTFLTTGVYDVLSTTSLSSVSMPSSPLALIAFPTFNHVELGALLNEITPERLFLVNGMPPNPRNQWRVHAISELNKNAQHFVNKEKRVSTLLYDETIEALNSLYSDQQVAKCNR